MPARANSACVCLTAGLMFFAPLWAVAAPSAAEPSSPAAQAKATSPIAAVAPPIEMSYVPETAVVGVLVQSSRMLTSAEFESAPHEVLQAIGLEQYGIDPLDITQALLLASLLEYEYDEYTDTMLMPSAILQLSQPYSLEDTIAARHPNWEQKELNGKLLLVENNYEETCYYMPDETTLLVGYEQAIEAMVAQGTAPGSKLVEFLSSAGDEHDIVAVLDIDPLRPMIETLQQQLPQGLPAPLARLQELPPLLSAVQATVNLTGDRPSTLNIIATDEDAAEEMETILAEAFAFGRGFLLATLEEEMSPTDDPLEQATLAYAERVTAILIEEIQPERDGNRLTLRYQPRPGDHESLVRSSGLALAMAMPAIFAARAAARRYASGNNMRQLSMAMKESSSRGLQLSGVGGAAGEQSGLSWRVHMLPYLFEADLYQQFHLDEPWDSEHNLTLIESMPEFFSSPAVKGDEPGYTHFQLVTGEGTTFDGERNGPSSDDAFAVIMVEADTPVIWTQPADWEYDADDPLHDLGHLYPNSMFNALFGDGHLETLSVEDDPDMFRLYLTPYAER